MAGTQRAPIRILHDFLDILRNIRRNIRNDVRKERRIRILLKPPGGEYRRRSFLISAALWIGKEVLRDCVAKSGVF